MTYKALWIRAGSGLLISMLEKINLFIWCINSGGIDVKMGMPVLEEKSSFEMLGQSFFSKLDWGTLSLSLKFP